MKIEIDEKTLSEVGLIWLAVLGPIAFMVFLALVCSILKAILEVGFGFNTWL